VPIRYVSLCSGIEAASVAWDVLGFEPLAFAEVEPYPSAVLAHRYPDVPNLGDIANVDWKPYKGRVDLVVGGTPCFTAGTLVLCEDGFKPIEQVRVGDRVVTHKGRLRKVLDTGARVTDVGVLKICGVMPIECTPSHPILTSKRTQRGKANEDGSWFRFESEKFVSAEDAVGLCACMVPDIDCLVPEYPKVYDLDNVEIAELIGWYLGDGLIAGKGRRNPTLRTLELSICPSKLVGFVARFKQKMNYRVERIDDTRCRVVIHNTELCRFLERHFGRGAANKNIPAWALALSDAERQAIVRGYMATDGHKYESGVTSAESVSKALTIGIQLLSRVGSVAKPTERGTSVIKGVEYRVKPSYKVTLGKSGGRCQIDNGYVKRIVQSFTPSGTATVYNLEVEDDNSYTADGIAVHNCQAFSISGKRGGLMDPRGQLMLEYVRAVREIEPRWLLWENVPGVLSQDRGRAFGTLLAELDELGYGLAWRVLDSQFFGVPQRRRRVFLVGCLGSGGVPQRFYLSARACSGILRRARRRGRSLPPQLETALTRVARGGITAFKYSASAAARSMPTYDDGTCNTLTADWHSPAIAIRTANTSANGCGISDEVAHTVDASGPEAVAYRRHDDEPLVMASTNGNAEIGSGGGSFPR